MTIEELVNRIQTHTHARAAHGGYDQPYHAYWLNFLYSGDRVVSLEISGETFEGVPPDRLIRSAVDHIWTCLAMSPQAAAKQRMMI